MVEALREMFLDGCEAPLRHHHGIEGKNGPAGTMLLMPAWMPGSYLRVKLVNVFQGNGARDLPAVQGVYVLFSGEIGEVIGMIEGNELTSRRTVAASALASSYLVRPDAETLLVVGTGRLARLMAEADAVVRPISHVVVWGRESAKADALVDELGGGGFGVAVATELEGAAAKADIISSVTLSREPLVKGQWLKPGTHLDLVGGFTPQMRETDDEAVERSNVFIDTLGAIAEAGDIIIPLANGVLKEADICADLAALARGHHAGRSSADAITFFKSVGASQEDLAAAILVYERSEAAVGA
jgi:alanine dehydrogenase